MACGEDVWLGEKRPTILTVGQSMSSVAVLRVFRPWPRSSPLGGPVPVASSL